MIAFDLPDTKSTKGYFAHHICFISDGSILPRFFSQIEWSLVIVIFSMNIFLVLNEVNAESRTCDDTVGILRSSLVALSLLHTKYRL